MKTTLTLCDFVEIDLPTQVVAQILWYCHGEDAIEKIQIEAGKLVLNKSDLTQVKLSDRNTVLCRYYADVIDDLRRGS